MLSSLEHSWIDDSLLNSPYVEYAAIDIRQMSLPSKLLPNTFKCIHKLPGRQIQFPTSDFSLEQTLAFRLHRIVGRRKSSFNIVHRIYSS